jgi:hypothetical protein
MIPKGIDSLDLVEMVMTIEEIFGIDIPANDAEEFGSPSEIVDWLELHLSNKRPNKRAIALLRGLAQSQERLELAEGLDGPWRREQIGAIIRELLR